jgi:catalase (peroxidase I)
MKVLAETLLVVLSMVPSGTNAGCPYLREQQQGHGNEVSRNRHLFESNQGHREGDYGVPDGGYTAVVEDIKALLTDSKSFFPADDLEPQGPWYGGLMIRLAWHCSGSYRDSDGRGGCDGGRIRFDPELNWPDNANLNQALKLLEPIKEKYGSDLSWGDLIILSGNAAIEMAGGPILGFCGGRIDDADGANSLKLGPSDEQEAIAPCVSINEQGRCQSPLGPSTMGLIYVNPAGPVGFEGDPVASGVAIRDVFGRMGFNDRETVALIGGGHAFGSSHGACADPPCGNGIGNNTFTSGFQGVWTTQPSLWTNEFFNNLYNFDWNQEIGSGGFIQWFPTNKGDSERFSPNLFMLTTDLAMAQDPDYDIISQEFASDIGALEEEFKYAWYRLTTSDMGPVERCLGENVPPVQPFQHPLPPAPTSLPDYIPVRRAIEDMLASPPEEKTTKVTALTNLAYRCASTFRETDYKGGCNGARIRFAPESEWSSNAGTADAVALLEPIKLQYPEVSYSDLIVLAGQTAIESAGGNAMKFCGGRVDVTDSQAEEQSRILAPREYSPLSLSIRDDMHVKGLTAREGVALAGRSALSKQFYVDLSATSSSTATDIQGLFSDEELALLEDEELKQYVEEFATSDESVFLDAFASAWTKMMIADRFDGPNGNVCTDVDTPTGATDSATASATSSGASVVDANSWWGCWNLTILMVGFMEMFAMFCC